MAVLISKTTVKRFGALQIEPLAGTRVVGFTSLVKVDGAICLLARGQEQFKRSRPKGQDSLAYLRPLTIDISTQ